MGPPAPASVGRAEIERGRSTYTLESGRLTVVDAVYRDGAEPIEFARIVYERGAGKRGS